MEAEAGCVGMSRASLVDRTAFCVIRKVQEGPGEEAHETDLGSLLETQLAEADLAMALVGDTTAGTGGSATLNRIVVDIHSGSGLRHSQHAIYVSFLWYLFASYSDSVYHTWRQWHIMP